MNTLLCCSYIAGKACIQFDYFWVGGNERDIRGVWQWVADGQNVTYTNWAPQQPNSVSQNCMTVDSTTTKWFDSHCTLHRLAFVCEVKPT